MRRTTKQKAPGTAQSDPAPPPARQPGSTAGGTAGTVATAYGPSLAQEDTHASPTRCAPLLGVNQVGAMRQNTFACQQVLLSSTQRRCTLLCLSCLFHLKLCCQFAIRAARRLPPGGAPRCITRGASPVHHASPPGAPDDMWMKPSTSRVVRTVCIHCIHPGTLCCPAAATRHVFTELATCCTTARHPATLPPKS